MKTRAVTAAAAVLALTAMYIPISQAGTPFTYQGSLSEAGAVAEGIYDFRFAIYATASGGAPLAGPIPCNEVAVGHGLFAVTLDFGEGVFTGDQRWLEIGVRSSGIEEPFVTLTPRQPLLPVPYALHAQQVGTVTVVELALGGRSAWASHIYAGPGVYVVTVTVTDDDTGSATASSEYVVLYEPTAGFVTGAGWIESPPGAYRLDPSIAGRAHFGFVSRYQKGANVPSGRTEFRFQAADLDFRATDFEWLVIAGAQAKFKGWGQINRQGDYGFMVSARDSALPGGGDADAFRIQIWDRATEIVVYDNQFEDDPLADATTAIGGGAIAIHAQ
jgi:hypothetical protein